MGAFVYGRKSEQLRPILIGVALMIFPYFVGVTWVLYTVGSFLTAGLFLFRE